MNNPLVVVESPTKVRTIKKFLGEKYTVCATVGHIKDLPTNELGVDIKNNFSPIYITAPGKHNILKKLKQNAANATNIYLAPDPDREGEAIAWHTAEILKKKGRKFHRVLFYELTKKAILEAMANPKNLDEHKYEAQKTRRILDRLVGYEISPLLWKKVKKGLSAGRVQSVSVKIVCDKEKKIRSFETTEFWSITATFQDKYSQNFCAKLLSNKNKKIIIQDKKNAQDLIKELSSTVFSVERVILKTKKRNPYPPFITSKLQQESSRKLRFSAKKTMLIAQQLYEGVDISPGEPTGLITYMRTDSVRVSKEAAIETIKLINIHFGKEYIPKKPRSFKNKKRIQDAHEAIRPTSVFNTPEKMKLYLSEDQINLYTLIWQRFVSSQMEHALINYNAIIIKADTYKFSLTNSSIEFLGFMKLYQSLDDKAKKQQSFLALTEGQILNLTLLTPKQHFTQPPARFSEATLVKELEENGIGRPSTYATIISNIREKGYVELLNNSLRPTELGFIVNSLLTKSFPEIMDVDFTAKMENELDQIGEANANANEVLNNFYKKFSKKVAVAKTDMLSVRGIGIPTDIKCPQCDALQLRIKMGKNGHFMACNKYPECTYSSNYKRDEKGNISLLEPFKPELTDESCSKCGNPMAVKLGKYGKFLACTGYPECKNTRSVKITENKSKIIIKCPENQCSGKVIEKSSKRGKLFYGCTLFPKCKFASWYKPTNKLCSKCNSNYLVEKKTKKEGSILACLSKNCNYIEPNVGRNTLE